VFLRYSGHMKETCRGPECVSPIGYPKSGLCRTHYQQMWKGRELTPKQAWKWEGALCEFGGCQGLVRAKGLCGGHYQQRRRDQELTSLRETKRTDIRDESGRKRCSKCREWLPESEFYPLRSQATRDGLSTNCNLCDLLCKYQITANEYREILRSQGGGCAICHRVTEVVCVDHDHSCCPERKRSCGKCVRGLLCPDCNGALGLMADDPQRLRNAADYLEGVSS